MNLNEFETNDVDNCVGADDDNSIENGRKEMAKGRFSSSDDTSVNQDDSFLLGHISSSYSRSIEADW